METLGFQPVLAQTLLVTFLRKRYCFHVLAPTLLFSRPCANVVGITSLQFYVATSSQLLIFPSLFHSFSSLLNCFFRPDFCYAICSGCVRDAFGMRSGYCYSCFYSSNIPFSSPIPLAYSSSVCSSRASMSFTGSYSTRSRSTSLYLLIERS